MSTLKLIFLFFLCKKKFKIGKRKTIFITNGEENDLKKLKNIFIKKEKNIIKMILKKIKKKRFYKNENNFKKN